MCNFIVAYIPFHAFRILFYKHVMQYKINKGASIHLGCKFNCKGKFSLGINSTINQFCRIDNRGGVYIGDNVSVSPYVKLITADHNLYDPACVGREAPIIIKDYCFIGSDAMILPGVTMERGSALGAKSLLNRNTEPDFVYAGMPAIQRKSRGGVYTYSASYKRWFH